jgi:hypothetical protein
MNLSNSANSDQDSLVLPIPQSAKELTPAWLSSALGFEIDEESFVVTPNSEAGNGFLSSLLRVSCEKKEDNETLNLIIKLLPEDPLMRTIVLQKEFDKSEIQCYQKLLPSLGSVVPELIPFFCPFFNGTFRTQDGVYKSVLILQDLKPYNYFTVGFGEEMKSEQLAGGIDFLVKLHFAGSRLEQDLGKPLSSIYNFLDRDVEEQREMFLEMFKDGLLQLDKLLSVDSELDGMREPYSSLVQYTPCILKLISTKCSESPVLIHGDPWSNNILFNEDPQMNMKVIDWQLVGYKDPTVDIGVYIISSLPTHQITKENVYKYLKIYYDSYVEHCLRNGSQTLIKRDWETFFDFFNTFGLAYSMIWFVLSLDSMMFKEKAKVIEIFDFLNREMNIPQFLINEAQTCISD